MNISISQSFNVATYLSECEARRRRLMSPANAFKAVPALTVVHRAPERPLWRTQAISFDWHVLAYQWQLANMVNPARDYVKQRCIELGADYAKISVKGRRTRDITGHRQLIMYELKTKFQLSYPRIGREFGGVDHTTVMHAVARIAKLRGEEKPEFVSSTDRLLSDPELKQGVIDDYQRGMSVEDVAEKFAISECAIVKVAKLENWHKPNRPLLQDTRLKPAVVDLASMQFDYEAGVTIREISLKQRVSQTTVRRIKDRHGWVRGVAK